MVCGKNPRRLFGSFTPKVEYTMFFFLGWDGQGGIGIRIRMMDACQLKMVDPQCLDHLASSEEDTRTNIEICDPVGIEFGPHPFDQKFHETVLFRFNVWDVS